MALQPMHLPQRALHHLVRCLQFPPKNEQVRPLSSDTKKKERGALTLFQLLVVKHVCPRPRLRPSSRGALPLSSSGPVTV